MKLVLLGVPELFWPLIRQTIADGGQCVAWAAEQHRAPAQQQFPALRWEPDPAALLNERDAALVCLGTSQPEALEAARQLVADGRPLLLTPDADQGAEFIYQLGLLRDEQPDAVRIAAVWPDRWHPGWLALQQLLQSGRLGRLLQCQWDREVSVPAGSGLTSKDIDQALLADLDLIREAGGEFDQVTLVGTTGASPDALLAATVSLAGARAVPSVWSIRCSPGATASRRLTLTCEQGSISALLQETGWQVTVRNGAEETHTDYPAAETPGWLPLVLTGFIQPAVAPFSTSGLPGLTDLLRAFEVIEGSHRSRARRRTIDLLYDVPSERSTFKSQMTAVGCGVLLLTLFAMLLALGVGLVAHELKLPPVIMHIVRGLVFLPVFVFLALQTLVLLTRPTAPAEKAADRAPAQPPASSTPPPQ